MLITLDTNCLIDLDENRTNASAVRELIARHRAGSIQVRIPSIMASERQAQGLYYDNFEEFRARLVSLGLDDLPRLAPMCYFGIGFFDHCVLANESKEDLEKRIHQVLHPDVQFKYSDFCAARKIDPTIKPLDARWRNRKCDVQVMWTHIFYQGDVLVTSDQNFMKDTKIDQLIALGASHIADPGQAIELLDRAV